MKEGTGGDGVSVTFREINDLTPLNNAEAIPGYYFASMGNPDAVASFYLKTQPAPSSSTTVGNPILLGTGAYVSPTTTPIAYQWQQFDTASGKWKDVFAGFNPSANTSNFVFTPTASGTYQFQGLVSVPGIVLTTIVAQVTVPAPEATPTAPSLLWASANTNCLTITARFSEPVTKASAETTANYALVDNTGTPFTFSTAALQPDACTVVLTVAAPLTANNQTYYTLTASSIADVDNGLTGGGAWQFYVPSGFLRFDVYANLNSGTNTLPVPIPWWNPSITGLVTNKFVYTSSFSVSTNGTTSFMENYVGRVEGFLIPPSNGVYRFFVGSDDASQLWMNTNEVNSTAVTGKVMIASAASANLGYVNPPSVSPWIALKAGQRYYVEALLKEGTGGDYISAAVREYADQSVPFWSSATFGTTSDCIPASWFGQPDSLTITPTTQTVFNDGDTAVFGTVIGVPAGVQWYTNDVAIAGATNLTLTLSPITAAYNGLTIKVLATNAVTPAPGAAYSFAVTVNSDTIAPTMVSTYRDSSLTNLMVTFSEPLAPATASVIGNYTITPTVAIISATLQADGRTVVLGTAGLDPNTQYTVTVNNVTDRATPANVIAGASTVTAPGMVFTPGFLMADIYYFNAVSMNAATVTNDARFKANTPDQRLTLGSADFHTVARLPLAGFANYGAKIYGWFTPPPTPSGSYKFYIRVDDGVILYLNPNGPSPIGKQQIATVTSSGNYAASAAISLTPGQPYYIELLYWQGTGQEYVSLDFRDSAMPTPPIPNNQAIAGSAGWGSGYWAGAEVACGAFFGAYGDSQAVSNLTFTVLPTSTNVLAGQPVTLTAQATASPANSYIFYQWQKDVDGAGTWANLGPATTNFIADYVMLGNCSNYTAVYSYSTTLRVVATVPGGITLASPPVTVTVTDEFKVTSVAGITSNQVYLYFNKPVDAASVSPSLYLVNGLEPAAVQIQPDGLSIRLTPASSVPINGAFTVTLEFLPEATGNEYLVAAEYTGQAMDFDYLYDMGSAPLTTDPLLPGSATPISDTALDMVAGGSDIWNAANGCYYAARWVTGDFDIRTRVNTVTNFWRGLPDANAKAGFIAAVSTNANTRQIAVTVNPPAPTGWPVTGANNWTLLYRDVTAGSCTSINLAGAWNNVGTTPWIRMVRKGSMILGYRSLDGVNWTLHASRDTAVFGGAYPDTILVGFAATSHNNTTNTPSVPNVQPGLVKAEFRDIHFPYPATIVTQPPATLAGPVGSTLPITVEASMPADGGALIYQWRKDGVPIASANSATLVLNNLQPANAGIYTCVVSDDGGGAVSSPCVVSVINQPPTVTATSFSINQNSALTTNYNFLIAGSTDPEGRPVSLFDVSGIAPVTFFANFDNGVIPARTAAYGNGQISTTGYTGNSMMLNAAIASTNGAWIIDDLITGRPVTSFLVNFKFRLADGNATPADGMSFNIASDLPNNSAQTAEDGVGTGFSFCIDNYDSGGGEAPALDIKWRGVVVWHYPILKMYTTGWIPVSLVMHPDGTVDVSFNNVQVATGVQTGYTPVSGARYGFYARAGGSFESHAVDDVGITVLSSQTSLASSRTVGTATDFSAGIPANAKIYGNAYLTNNGAGYNYVQLTDPVANQNGSIIFDELTPYTLVRSFAAEFDLRIAEGSATPADGFSFNFAPDLAIAAGQSYVNPVGFAAGTYGAEEGIGTGLSVTVDNYPITAPTIKVKWKGIANTVLSSNLVAPWINADFVHVTVTLTSSNTLTVATNGVPVFDNVPVPFAPTRGRFGFYARTGGSLESHAVGNISLSVDTFNTFAWYSDLNYFLPQEAKLYGNAYYTNTSGANDSPAIRLLDAATNQFGSVVIDEMTPFKPVSSFNATFLLRIGDGSSEPADGVSFNFASDLPDGTSGSAEEGVGTGLSLCIDNYRGVANTANTAAMKLKWKGLEFASTPIPVWNSTNYVPVIVSLNANGTITVTTNGVAVWSNLQTPYSPIRGRFGFYARTGGQYQSVSVDNLAFYLPDPGYVGLQGTNLVYVPPQNTMGTDTIYYMVTDGAGGYAVGSDTVTVMDLTAPMILDVPHIPISLSNDCQARIPDFNLAQTRVSLGLMATDTVGFVTVEQTPLAGTLVGMGTQSISVIVRDASGNATNRTFDLVVTDLLPPVFTSWPADLVITNCEYVVPDMTASLVAVDCHGFTLTQVTPAGTVFTGGTNRITFMAVDTFNNTSTVQTVVIIPSASPLAANDYSSTKMDAVAVFQAGKLMGNDRHPDGREIFISLVNPSTNGATVTLSPDRQTVTYTPTAGFTGRDAFTYQLSDPCGHTATATVVVDVYAGGQAFNLLSLVQSNGVNTLQFQGIPGRAYSLQRTPSLSSPVWTTLTNKVADPQGLILFEDAAPLDPQGFYRTLNEAP
jgi:hypothetical protein